MVARNLFQQCRGGGSGRHAVFPNKTELNTNVLVHGARLFLRALIIFNFYSVDAPSRNGPLCDAILD